MPQIIYFNGRRVALGDDLEPIVLFEPAHPGDKILVAVKLLHTVDDKRFTGVNLRVEPLDTLQEYVPTRTTSASNASPPPTCCPSCPHRGAICSPPSKPPSPPSTPPHSPPATRPPSTPRSQGAEHPRAAARRPRAGQGRPRRQRHIDAAWLWPRSETIDVVKRTFTTALQLMNEYPDYTYTQSAAQYSSWMADKYPALNAQIAQRIKEGRWEIVGGMWVEPDLNLPGGESLVRQLLVGQREFQQLYGVTARIGWNPDSFGYNWQLPQIYKRSGLDYFVTQKMHWNDTNVLPFRLFWWQSPDGSKVLTYFPTDYVHDNVNPTRISADFAESAQRNPGTTEMLDLYGIGDHGGGPTRDMLDQADHWIACRGPESKTWVTLEQDTVPAAAAHALRHRPTLLHRRRVAPQPRLADVELRQHRQGLHPPPLATGKLATGRLEADSPNPDQLMSLPTWNDELYFEYHRGVYTTQANHKRNMRVSETQTLDAEKLASLAWLDGAAYPADILTENWKKITFNQFHDLAAGSGIAVIYRDAQQDFTEVANANKQIDESALKTIDAHIDTRIPAPTSSKPTPTTPSNTTPGTSTPAPSTAR
jgi:alpha-mannosidase